MSQPRYPWTGWDHGQVVHGCETSLDKTTLTLLIGESGHPLSKHYRDQFPAWMSGEGVPLSFAISASGRDKLRLEP